MAKSVYGGWQRFGLPLVYVCTFTLKSFFVACVGASITGQDTDELITSTRWKAMASQLTFNQE